MARIPVWFERRFEFTFPVEMLPNLLARLRGTPARLEEALRGVPREVLIAKPGGKWSAQEHAGHLVDLESLWLARIGDFVAGVPELTVADLTNRRTNEANHNGRVLEEVLAAFRTARAALLTGVDEFPATVCERSIPHPRLRTPMRVVDHLYFVAEHDDHHLAWIWELTK